jgi:hypothetical protein
MPNLELTPERLELLRQTVEEALGIAQEVLEDLIDGDPLVEDTSEAVALFDVQHERVLDLRDLLNELLEKR